MSFENDMIFYLKVSIIVYKSNRANKESLAMNSDMTSWITPLFIPSKTASIKVGANSKLLLWVGGYCMEFLL